MALGRGTAALPASWRNARVVAAAVAGALLLVGWFAGLWLRGSLSPVHLALYLAAIAIGGYHVGRAGVVALARGRGLTIMVVMLLAAVALAALGQVAAGALLIVLYAAADATAAYAEQRQRSTVVSFTGARVDMSRAASGIERIGARIGVAILLIGLVAAVVLPLISLIQDQWGRGEPGLEDAPWGAWAVRATMVVVAATPCAPILAIPLALAATLVLGARRGVLITDARSVGALARIRVVALDQASAVTRGAAEVTDILPWRDAPSGHLPSPQEVIALAAGVVRQRSHPLARAIMAHAAARAIEPVAAGHVRALADVGTVARVDGSTVFVGRPDLFMGPLHISLDAVRDPIARWQDEGKAVVVVGDRTGVRGLIALRAPVYPAVREGLAALRAAGVRRVALLTDSDARTARALARDLGIDTIIADLTPETTVAAVRDLTRQYGDVALVGDGVGDAGALTAATVGVALAGGARRRDTEADDAPVPAGVAVVADDLGGVAHALTLARRNQGVIRQTVALWAIVAVALIGGLVAGVLSLPGVVLGHELGEFVAIAGAVRLLHAGHARAVDPA
jgi:cation transport ATPase